MLIGNDIKFLYYLHKEKIMKDIYFVIGSIFVSALFSIYLTIVAADDIILFTSLLPKLREHYIVTALIFIGSLIHVFVSGYNWALFKANSIKQSCLSDISAKEQQLLDLIKLSRSILKEDGEKIIKDFIEEQNNKCNVTGK